MKELYKKIMKVLCGVKSDKYLHYIVGLLIAALIISIFNINLWIRLSLAICIPILLEIFKEYVIDSSPNIKDIIWTIGGIITGVIIGIL